MSTGSVNCILTEDLCMWRVSEKFVFKVLARQLKQLCMEIAPDMLDSKSHDLDFIKTIIIGNEVRSLWLRLENQVPVFPMKASVITKAQNCRTSLQQCEDNVDLFLWFMKKYNRANQPIRNTIWRLYIAFIMLCIESGRTCRQRRIDNFTTTMHPLIPPT